MALVSKALGVLLVILGIVAIGFLDLTPPIIGSVRLPLIENLDGWFGHAMDWWNIKLMGVLLGAAGLLLLKYT